MKLINPFHAFFYIKDIKNSVNFYHKILGCPVKYSNLTSFTIDFFGHGISFEVPENGFELGKLFTCSTSDIDHRQYVPSMHWGINIATKVQFNEILNRIYLYSSEIQFVVPPTFYNEGKPNEQCLFFIKDPTGYVLEFRYMARAFKLEELEEWDQRSEGHERTSISS